MKKTKVNNIADKFSNIIINKILKEEIDINDGILISSRILIMILGKTLPDDKFKECNEKTIDISTQLVDILSNLDNKYSITEISLILNSVLEYFINNSIH